MTDKKDNAPKVVTELERYRRRIIRSTARLIREKKTPDEIWQIMKDETGCDCETLWNRMRALTIKKLNRLIAADDNIENIPPVARLTNTDWLLFDLALVHEDIDVIGQKKIRETGAEYKPIMELFSLVQKFEIEDLILSENYDKLPQAWALATLHYNKGGRMCSPMLLQKRWFQLKEVTRAKFYGFWKLYRGNMNNLKTAKLFVPTKLQTVIAKRFQHLVTSNSISWEEAYERKAIVSPEELTLMMKNSAGLRNSLEGDDNAPDIVLLEPVIETVTLDSDSESESKDEPSASKDEITTKIESSQINIKKDVTEYLADFPIDEVDDIRIEETDKKSRCSDNEEDKKLNLQNVNITTQISDETNVSTPQIDNYLEISNNITQERDEILRSYNVVDSTPQILNVISLSKSSSHENINKVGSLIMPEEEKNYTKMSSDDEEAEDDVIITMPHRIFGDDEKVHNSVELNTEVPANENVSKDVIDFVNDDIEFVDDGTDESGNEEESGEHKTEDEDIVMKIDPKLLMTVEVCTIKLDDMFELRGNSFQTIKDSRIINSILAQSKPVSMLKENVSSIKTANETSIEQENYESKVDINDINENFKVSYSSKLLKKPISLNYNPIQLCKNPDFNTRLKRLTVGFFSSMRNRQQYKVCKPITIDVSKAFESKLVDGTLYLKNGSSREQPCPKQQNVDNHSSQQVSVLPSAMPVQSLIDHTVVSCDDAEVDKISDCEIDKFNQEELENGSDEHDRNKLLREYLLSERNRAIKLQDIIQVRRINKNLLTAEVSPIRLSKPSVEISDNTTVDTTHNTEVPKYDSDLNKDNSKNDLLSATFSPTSITATIKPTTSDHNNLINDENNQEDEKIAPNFIKTAKTLSPESNKNLNNQTNPQITPLTPSSIQTNDFVSSDLINPLNKDKSKKKTLLKKPSVNDIPWFKRLTYPNIEESLLTLDTLNKMLIILSSDDPDSKDISKSEKTSKATTASTVSNKTKTIPPKKKPRKKVADKCCWIRKKIGNPFLANRYHLCKANKCNCCCKSYVLSSIEEYKNRNETDAVMQLTVFFRYFQKKYGGQLEGVDSVTPTSSQNLTINNPVSKSPIINVDQDKTNAKSIEENSQQTSNINSVSIPPLIPIARSAKSNVSCELNVPTTSSIQEQALATSHVSSSSTVYTVNTVSSSTTIPSIVITTEPIDVAVDNDASTVLVSAVTSISSPSSFSKNVISHEAVGINDLTVNNVLEASTVSESLSVTGDNNDINVPEMFGKCLFVNSEPILVDESTNYSTVPNAIKSNIPSPVNESQTNLMKRCYNKPLNSNISCICLTPMICSSNNIIIDGTNICPIHKQPKSTDVKTNTKVLLLNKKLLQTSMYNTNSPMFLGNNQILLTSAKFPNKQNQSIFTSQMSVATVPDDLMPPGIQLLLLPDGRLTYTKYANMELTDQQVATLPMLISSIQDQLETALTTILPEETPKDSNVSNKSNPNETVLLVDDTDESVTLNKNMKDPSNISNENNLGNIISLIDEADHINTPNSNPNEGQENLSTQSTSREFSGTPIENRTIAANFDTKTSESEAANTTLVSNNIESRDPQNDIHPADRNISVEQNCTHDKEISTNNADTAKKSILSDLMAMSGILTEDTKCISPKTSPVKVVLDTSGVKQNLAHSIHLHSSLSSTKNSYDNSKEISELYPVNSYEELRYACDVKARFFKLDFQTGVITQIKVCISKKKNKSRNNLSQKCDEVIDLTEYTSDAETSNMSTQTEDKMHDKVPAKRIMLQNNFKRRKVNIFRTPKIAMDTHLKGVTEGVKPIHLFKVSHTKRKRNNNHEINIAHIPHKRRKQQIEAKIDLVDSDTPMEEEYLLDSSEDDQENYVSESDDEPLSVIAKRIHKPVVESNIQETEVPTEGIIIEEAVESTVNDSGIPVLHTEVAVEDDGMEKGAQPLGMIPIELFPESDDGDDDCILGF